MHKAIEPRLRLLIRPLLSLTFIFATLIFPTFSFANLESCQDLVQPGPYRIGTLTQSVSNGGYIYSQGPYYTGSHEAAIFMAAARAGAGMTVVWGGELVFANNDSNLIATINATSGFVHKLTTGQQLSEDQLARIGELQIKSSLLPLGQVRIILSRTPGIISQQTTVQPFQTHQQHLFPELNDLKLHLIEEGMGKESARHYANQLAGLVICIFAQIKKNPERFQLHFHDVVKKLKFINVYISLLKLDGFAGADELFQTSKLLEVLLTRSLTAEEFDELERHFHRSLLWVRKFTTREAVENSTSHIEIPGD